MKWFGNSTEKLLKEAKAYKEKGDYSQAKELFSKVYRKRVTRGVVQSLLECCIQTGSLEEAEQYFNEFHRLASNDTTTLYCYRYQIEKRKGRALSLLITILEELKASDYLEEYAYELAKLYHKAGRKEECMGECEEIILWFGEGVYVERAKALLAYYKGEISLEEIKTAGERYVAEQRAKQKEEPDSKQIATDAEQEKKAKVGKEVNIKKARAGEATEKKQASAGEAIEKKQVSFGGATQMKQTESGDATEIEQLETRNARLEKTEVTEREQEEEELPEIDLSGIDCFEEASEQSEEDIKQQTNYNDESKKEYEQFGDDDVQQTDSHEIPIEEFEEPASRESFELYEPASVQEIEVSNDSKLGKLLKSKEIDLEEECGNFVRIEAVRKQIIRSLEMILSERERFFLVVTGEHQTGKTTLACDMVKLLFKLGILKFDRTAVIDAKKLNEISILNRKNEIENCNLLIENAGELKETALEELQKLFRGKKKGTCVILEDNSRKINTLLRGKEDMNRVFNNRIHLPKYSTEDLMGFAFDYIAKEDYSIDKMAAEALKRRIEQIIRIAGDDKRLKETIRLVKEMIENSEKRNGNAILAMAATGQFKAGNYLVLIADDINSDSTIVTS